MGFLNQLVSILALYKLQHSKLHYLFSCSNLEVYAEFMALEQRIARKIFVLYQHSFWVSESVDYYLEYSQVIKTYRSRLTYVSGWRFIWKLTVYGPWTLTISVTAPCFLPSLQ